MKTVVALVFFPPTKSGSKWKRLRKGLKSTDLCDSAKPNPTVALTLATDETVPSASTLTRNWLRDESQPPENSTTPLWVFTEKFSGVRVTRPSCSRAVTSFACASSKPAQKRSRKRKKTRFIQASFSLDLTPDKKIVKDRKLICK